MNVCIIIDANLASLVFSTPVSDDFRPIFEWILHHGGALVHGGKNSVELYRVESARRLIREWARAGRAYQHPEKDVDKETRRVIAEGNCISDDPHIIALARLTNVRLVCTRDKDLHKDFKSCLRKPPGSVYQRRSHSRLLKHTAGCIGRPRS